MTNSSFANQGFSSIQYQNGTSGRAEDNEVTACGSHGCIRIVTADSVDVIGNTMHDERDDVDPFFHHAATVGSHAFARVEGNVFDGCGAGACLLGYDGATVEVVDNEMTVYAERGTRFGVIGSDGSLGQNPNFWPPTLTVTDDTITGVGGSGAGPGDFAISAIHAEFGATITAQRNTIGNAEAGIRAFAGGVVADASHNVIDGVFHGVGVFDGSELHADFNDITNTVEAIATRNVDPSLGDLTCNWWGSTAGPQNTGGAPASGIPRDGGRTRR